MKVILLYRGEEVPPPRLHRHTTRLAHVAQPIGRRGRVKEVDLTARSTLTVVGERARAVILR